MGERDLVARSHASGSAQHVARHDGEGTRDGSGTHEVSAADACGHCMSPCFSRDPDPDFLLEEFSRASAVPTHFLVV
jgi:hypothetical protein